MNTDEHIDLLKKKKNIRVYVVNFEITVQVYFY